MRGDGTSPSGVSGSSVGPDGTVGEVPGRRADLDCLMFGDTTPFGGNTISGFGGPDKSVRHEQYTETTMK
jgi:hypothetical protein